MTGCRLRLVSTRGGHQVSLQITGALKDADNMAGVVEAVGMGGFPFPGARKKGE